MFVSREEHAAGRCSRSSDALRGDPGQTHGKHAVQHQLRLKGAGQLHPRCEVGRGTHPRLPLPSHRPIIPCGASERHCTKTAKDLLHSVERCTEQVFDAL